MKKDKMQMFLKRTPTEGLYDLFDLLIKEINSRKNAYRPLPKIEPVTEEVKFEC